MPDGVFCVLQADMCRDIVFSIRTFKSLRFVQGDRGFVVDVYQKRHAVRPVFLNRCRQKCAAKAAPAALFADEQVIRLIFRAVVGQVDISGCLAGFERKQNAKDLRRGQHLFARPLAVHGVQRQILRPVFRTIGHNARIRHIRDSPAQNKLLLLRFKLRAQRRKRLL